MCAYRGMCRKSNTVWQIQASMIAPDKALFQPKRIDIFLTSPQKHVVVLIRGALCRCFYGVLTAYCFWNLHCLQRGPSCP